MKRDTLVHIHNASMKAGGCELRLWRLPASVLWLPDATSRSIRRATAICRLSSWRIWF